MNFLELLITSIGLAMDSFAVSVSKGLNIKKFNIKYILLLTFSLGFFQALMPILGWILGINFQNYIINIDHWIAFILLFFIGANMIKESFTKEQDENKNDYSFKEVILLSIATSIDALTMGIAFVSLNINIIKAAIIIFLTTFIISLFGICISYLLKTKLKNLNKIATILGGLILIGIGIKILIEHLFLS